jgi:PAS domain-containing protein
MDRDAFGSLNSNAALWSAKAAGIFTWDVETNTVHGDAVIADFFHLATATAAEGLPLQAYLASIHDDDKPRVARSIHTAITHGGSYQEEYRLVHPHGTVIWVLAIGHCFRDRDGAPTTYAGVIYDITNQKTSATDGLSDHCNAAMQIAERLGNPRLVTLLTQAVDEAENEDLRAVLRKSVRH